MDSGPRSGQQVMHRALSDIRDARSLIFMQHRTDWPICVPARASILTGMFSPNHRMSASFQSDEYYSYYREGRRTTHQVLGSGYLFGPWERDLALKAQAAHGGWGPGATVTQDPINASSQGTPGGFEAWTQRADETTRGDTNDDLQAFTGNMFTWLAQAGVSTAVIGKWTNRYGTSAETNPPGHLGNYKTATNPNDTYLYVPPGIVHWAVLSGLIESTDPAGEQWGGSAGNQYHGKYTKWTGSIAQNPPEGDGITDGSSTIERFDYDRSEYTQVSASGTTVTVALAEHGMSVGDEFALEGATSDSNYEGSTLTVSEVPDADHFKYIATSAPTVSPITTDPIVVYPRRNYAESVWLREFEQFLDGRAEDEPWFMFYCPHNPHKGWTDADTQTGDDGPQFEVERRYIGALDVSAPRGFPEWHSGPDGPTHAGVVYSPAHSEPDITNNVDVVQPYGVGTARDEWQRRQEMMASVDDTIGGMIDACRAKGWHNVVLIFTSDNGWPQGEHNAEEEGLGGISFWTGGKNNLWESGVRSPLWIRDPRRGVGQVSHLPTTMGDLPLTVLDLFGQQGDAFPSLAPLLDHHAHAKRDGRSILRMLQSPPGRYVPLFHGQWRTGDIGNDNAEGCVSPDGFKLLRARGDTGLTLVHRLYDVSQDDSGVYTDYETTDLASTDTAKRDELNAAITPALEQRWNPTTNQHSIKGPPS